MTLDVGDVTLRVQSGVGVDLFHEHILCLHTREGDTLRFVTVTVGVRVVDVRVDTVEKANRY